MRPEKHRVALTGITGDLGACFALHLAAKGIRVHGLVREHSLGKFHALFREAGYVEPVIGDLYNPSTLRKLCEGSSCVYHFAADVGTENQPQAHASMIALNGYATGLLAAVVKAARGRPTQIIYASSQRVLAILDNEIASLWIQRACDIFQARIHGLMLSGHVEGELTKMAQEALKEPIPPRCDVYELSNRLRKNSLPKCV